MLDDVRESSLRRKAPCRVLGKTCLPWRGDLELVQGVWLFLITLLVGPREQLNPAPPCFLISTPSSAGSCEVVYKLSLLRGQKN